jgi:RHS repeat-associated protein
MSVVARVLEKKGDRAMFRQFLRHAASGHVHHTYTRIYLVLTLSCVLGTAAITARAQTYLENLGVPPFTTKLPVENGFINAANGDLHLEIPLGSFPQRAGSPEKIVLMYDSAIWSNAGINSYWYNDNISGNAGYPSGGWRTVNSRDAGSFLEGDTSWGYCSHADDYYWDTYSPWIWVAPDGTQHSFPASTTIPRYPPFCPGTGTPSSTAYASDASGYYISISNYVDATVYAPDGTIISTCADLNGCNAGFYGTKDSNGNVVPPVSFTFNYPVSTDTWVDTLGRNVLTWQQTQGSSTYTYSVPNAQGGTSTYTVHSQQINVCTNFGQPGVGEYCLTSGGNFPVITEIDLPDGTSYYFKYDCDSGSGNSACGSPSGQGAYYGLLTSMTMPTGATISYSYSNFTDATGNVYRWLTGRTTPDSWTYSPSLLSTCSTGYVDCQQQYTVTKPSGDQTIYTFTLNGGAWPTQVQYNDHVSGLLATTIQCFSFVSFSNGNCSYGPTPGSAATNVTKSGMTTTYPGTNINTTTGYQYDNSTYGNVTQIAEWNFYTGSLPTNADRTTNISYVYQTNSAYIGPNILNRPYVVVVDDKNNNWVAHTQFSYDQYALASATGIANHDDTNYGTGNTLRGNLTQVSEWLNTTGGSLTTTNTYDMLGNPIQTTDPNGNVTTLSYADNFYNASPSPATQAYVTQITRPTINSVSHIEKFQYYFGPGFIAASCGENFGSACTYGLAPLQADYKSFSYDSMNRLAGVNAGDGGQVTTSYGTTTPINVTTTAKIDASHTLSQTAVLDSLGRVSQTQTSSPQGTIYVDTGYDSNGRVHTVSNPHYPSSSPTDGTMTYSYDGLDRVLSLTEPSGGSETTAYNPDANSIMVQDSDELGNTKNSWVDAFGRTIQVNLFPGSGVIRTQYTYDLLNNLTKVDESGTNWSNDRVRTFTYDSLSRVLSATNPESGTTCFGTVSGGVCQNNGYDGNSNLIYKTNARGTTTTLAYDALNRLTSRSYNDGITPTANFIYDGCPTGGCPSGVSPQNPVSRMVEGYTSSGKTFYSYDVMGRYAKQWQCTPVNCGSSFIAFTYTHNYLDEQSSLSYNGNFTISQAYDGVARIYQVTNSNSNQYNPATIINVSQFSPIGLPTQISFGNGLAETRAYNNRLQTTQLRVYSPPSTDVLNQTLTWGDPNYGNRNNGVLWGWTASGSGTPTFSRSYTYDGINRLASMSSPADPSGCTGLSWTDDAWANRTGQTVTGGTCGQSSLTINTSNHVTNSGFGYDNDGNMTTGTLPFQYDAEGRLTQFNNGPSNGGANYVYDANGRRIEKIISGGQIHYFYDENGNVLVETDQNGNWTKDYVYMGGKRVAELSGGQTYLIHTDHLGSTRTVTNYAASITDKLDYLPYGEQVAGGSFTTHKFTGYDRDSVSGLDYANARYYNSSLGRFMSGDPAPGDISNPQSSNRYAYVGNNPLSLTDPGGLDASCGDSSCGGCDFSSCGGGCDFDFECGGCDITCSGGGGVINGPQPPIFIPPFTGSAVQPSTGDPNSSDPFSGETFGIPDGLGIPTSGLPGIFPTSDPGCEFGTCSATGEAFLPAAAGAGGIGICIILEPCGATIGAGTLGFGGAFLAITAAADLLRSWYEARHKKDARASTEQKHEEGEARKSQDRGGEKGDAVRRPPRKRPYGWKGPWPPAPGVNWW